MLDTSNFSGLDVLEISECSVYFLLITQFFDRG